MSKLPIEKSWSKEIIQYGYKDKTNLEFYYDGDTFVEILCRMDLRNIQKEEFDEIVDFMKENNALVFYKDTIYNATKRNLTQLIIESGAYKFCKNPKGFFEKSQDKNASVMHPMLQ